MPSMTYSEVPFDSPKERKIELLKECTGKEFGFPWLFKHYEAKHCKMYLNRNF